MDGCLAAVQDAPASPSTLKRLQALTVPPAGSKLASSLERGLLARKFTSFSRLGRGGFGDVVKAWDVEAQQWCAIKVIPAQLRADECIDECNKVWSGGAVFERLRRIRCRHVLRYQRRWTELPEDVAAALPQRTSPAACSAAASAGSSAADAEALAPDSAGVESTYAESWASESDGGFEWNADTVQPGRTVRTTVRSTALDTKSQRPLSPASPRRERGRSYQAVLLVQMEYYEGVTLAEWLSNPRSRHGLADGSLGGALNLAAQLVEGLVELHKEGIVHRDVKPENVIVSKVDGLIKIIDFGLSRLASEVEEPGSPGGQVSGMRRLSLCTSERHTAIGTPGYAPPEQCWVQDASGDSFLCRPRAHSDGAAGQRGLGNTSGDSETVGDISPCSDVFSAGVVLVELLMAAVRRGPAWGTLMERAAALRVLHEGYTCELPAELVAAPDVQGWMRRLVARMLSFDVAVRPSSFQVLNELTSGLLQQGRHNPYTGTAHAASVELSMPAAPPAACRNPYVGFFLDHKSRRCTTAA